MIQYRLAMIISILFGWLSTMKYALNLESNQYVEASVNTDKYASYVCPLCRKNVHFVSSSNRETFKKDPHFAHYPGEGTQKCENYCPPKEGIQVRYLGQKTSKQTVIKKSYSHHLEIHISDSYWSLKAVILTRRKRSDKVVENKLIRYFDPKTAYEFEIDNKKRCLPGLSENEINIFSGTSNRPLKTNQPLYWHLKYYIVWHQQIEVMIPKAVLGKELLPINEWKCAELLFPEHKKLSIENWVSDHLHRSMENFPDPERLSIVFPPNNTVHSIIIGINRDAIKESIQGELSLIDTDNLEKSKMIDQASPVFIDTEMTNTSLASMTFGKTKYVIPQKTDGSIKILKYPGVFLKTNKLCIEANDWRTTVENIESHQLQDISLPAKMPVHIIIDKKEVTLKESTIKPMVTESLDDFKKRLLDTVIASLKRFNVSLELDFNNYGSITLLKQKETRFKVSITDNIKKQIQWLNSMSWRRNKTPESHNDLKDYLVNQKIVARADLEPYFRSMNRKVNLWSY